VPKVPIVPNVPNVPKVHCHKKIGVKKFIGLECHACIKILSQVYNGDIIFTSCSHCENVDLTKLRFR